MIKIAVISGKGIHKAIDWIVAHAAKQGETIKEVILSRGTVTTNTATYKIVMQASDLNGGEEFNGYLVCPTYEDLVALVKERVRLKETSHVEIE